MNEARITAIPDHGIRQVVMDWIAVFQKSPGTFAIDECSTPNQPRYWAIVHKPSNLRLTHFRSLGGWDVFPDQNLYLNREEQRAIDVALTFWEVQIMREEQATAEKNVAIMLKDYLE